MIDWLNHVNFFPVEQVAETGLESDRRLKKGKRPTKQR